MTLAFSVSHLIWQKYDHTAKIFVSDEEQNVALRSFVDALYRSHGSDEKASGKQINEWIDAGHHSFFMMLKPLLAKLKQCVSLSSLNLVVLTHWTHDTLIGHSATNAVLHEAQAGSAFGIAVSDHGISSSWFALSLIDDYLTGENGDCGKQTALLLFADQNTSLHNSLYLKNISASPCAGVVLLEKMPAGLTSNEEKNITFKGYNKIIRSAKFNYTELKIASDILFTANEQKLPLVIIIGQELAVELSYIGLPDNEILQVWDESLMSVAPWALLKECVTPGNRYLFLQEENEGIFIAAFVSGGTTCT